MRGTDKMGFLEQSPSRLEISRLASYADFMGHALAMQPEYLRRAGVEQALISSQTSFTVPGYCYVCRMPVAFQVDFNYAREIDGKVTPNWRERLVCPRCGLCNRLRASIHLFHQECEPQTGDRIYLTEQVTPLYAWFGRNFPNVIGSEYLGDSIPYGVTNSRGIRNESLAELSFDDDRFDHILSFDVFEHIADYRQAFRECYRCLKPGGTLLFSVPFAPKSSKNIVRARTNPGGQIEHLLPPEYHGDPLSSQGCLCFYHFGWELLDQLRELRYEGVTALHYWSRELGYLGGEQRLFLAKKK